MGVVARMLTAIRPCASSAPPSKQYNSFNLCVWPIPVTFEVGVRLLFMVNVGGQGATTCLKNSVPPRQSGFHLTNARFTPKCLTNAKTHAKVAST